jgi:hypothetical protein
LVYEIALSSKTTKKDLLYFRKICKTRCAKLDRSQPAAAKRTRAKAQRERERERERERARPTLVLVCEREGQVVSQGLLRGNPSGSLFHFISHLQDTLLGPPRITLDCLHTLTNVAAKQKSKASGEEREAVHSKFSSGFLG